MESFEEDDGTLVLELRVADDDAGKVIGRGGRTVAALRTVMKAAAVRDGQPRAGRRRRLTLVTAGRVGKPHGLDGSFYVEAPRHALPEGTALRDRRAQRTRSSAAPAPTSAR